jgi:hypothetical protein
LNAHGALGLEARFDWLQALRTYYKACNGVTAPDTVATVAKTLQLDVSDVRLFFTLHRKKRKAKGGEKPMFSSAHHDSAAVP